jgi:hypothetical protein
MGMHACDPSFSKGRDQEDHGWRSAWAKSYQDPISINKLSMVVQTVIPGMQELQVGGSWPETSPDPICKTS